MKQSEFLATIETLKECARKIRDGATILEITVMGESRCSVIIPLSDANIRKAVADRLTVMGCELEFGIWNL